MAARRLAQFPSTVGSAMIKFPASLFLNVHLPYLNHDITFPSQTAENKDGAPATGIRCRACT